MAVDLLTQNALNKLIESSKDSFHVSIYIGTAKTGPETRKNRIKFKNLLDKSEKDLLSVFSYTEIHPGPRLSTRRENTKS